MLQGNELNTLSAALITALINIFQKTISKICRNGTTTRTEVVVAYDMSAFGEPKGNGGAK